MKIFKKLLNFASLIAEYRSLIGPNRRRLVQYMHELRLLQQSEVSASRFQNFNQTSPAAEREEFVFQYWGDGFDKAPDLIKACLMSVKENVGDGRYIFLNDETLENWIDIPKRILELKNSREMTLANYADFIRVALLRKYGGVWIDASCLITNPQFINCVLLKDFFIFENSSSLFRDSSLEMGNIHFSSWFIRARSESATFRFIENEMTAFLLNNGFYPHYYYLHILITAARNSNDRCRFEMSNLNSEINYNLDPHLLQFCLQHNFDKELFDSILSKSGVHKLAHQVLPPCDSSGITFYDHILRTFGVGKNFD